MLVFDQLKRNDPHLRAVTVVVLAGLGALLAGLWWVQVVCARDYRESLHTQSFRTVRIPAMRGKILDRRGAILAENRASYNVSLYLDELRRPVDSLYAVEAREARAELKHRMAAEQERLHRRLTKKEKKEFVLSTPQKAALRQAARHTVASNVVQQVGERLGQSLTLNARELEKHYKTRLVLPFPVMENLDATNIARFKEQLTSPLGVDLEPQSSRVYPNGTVAAHLLGALQRDDRSAEGEEAFFSFRLPDFYGRLGIEYGFDKELRGVAGVKSVLVNNMGYRQSENVWSPAKPGQNVVLTLDLKLQKAAERALATAPVPYAAPVRGAVVVMDVNTGDILAMASSPTLDPAIYLHPISYEMWQRIQEMRAQRNRATQDNYAPGSIFKLVVGLALLENGLDPDEIVHVLPNPHQPNKGHYRLGNRIIRDTADPGDYNFKRALKRSSNTYFIQNGLRLGPEPIVQLARKFHLGERIGLPLNQETPGNLPTLRRVRAGWSDGNTANLCIGQDPVLVTPLQVAVMTAAIANGGKVLWPRLVDRIEPQDPNSDDKTLVFPSGRVRDQLGVSARSLNILHGAMLAETEEEEGTGREARVEGLRICGKTGTAQVQDERNNKTGQWTWFASFAPFGAPRWAVVVLVEDGKSGTASCAPVAQKIWSALLELERARAAATTNLVARPR